MLCEDIQYMSLTQTLNFQGRLQDLREMSLQNLAHEPHDFPKFVIRMPVANKAGQHSGSEFTSFSLHGSSEQ